MEWSEKSNDGYRTYSTSEQYFVQYLTLLESGKLIEKILNTFFICEDLI